MSETCPFCGEGARAESVAALCDGLPAGCPSSYLEPSGGGHGPRLCTSVDVQCARYVHMMEISYCPMCGRDLRGTDGRR